MKKTELIEKFLDYLDKEANIYTCTDLMRRLFTFQEVSNLSDKKCIIILTEILNIIQLTNMDLFCASNFRTLEQELQYHKALNKRLKKSRLLSE